MVEDVYICIQRNAFVGYNIPLFWKNYKPFFRFFTDKRAKNRIFGETHKFNEKFPAN